MVVVLPSASAVLTIIVRLTGLLTSAFSAVSVVVEVPVSGSNGGRYVLDLQAS